MYKIREGSIHLNDVALTVGIRAIAGESIVIQWLFLPVRCGPVGVAITRV